MSDEHILSRLCVSANELANKGVAMLHDAEAHGPDEIHEFRVCTKRLRAYWRLAAPVVGREIAREHMNDLRDASRGLAAHRDEYVMSELLAELAGSARKKERHAISLVAEELFGGVDDRETIRYDLEIDVFEKALEVDGRRWEGYSEFRSVSADHALVREGFEPTYAKARRLGETAVILGTPAGFHRWRRWVKYAYYQYAWFRSVYPDVKPGMERRLKRLGSTLGRLHDAHHLLTELDSRSLGASSPKAFRRTRQAVLALEEELVAEVTRRGPKVLSREPAIMSQQILEAVRALPPDAGVPDLEFISLANHEGDGLASSADTADAH